MDSHCEGPGWEVPAVLQTICGARTTLSCFSLPPFPGQGTGDWVCCPVWPVPTGLKDIDLFSLRCHLTKVTRPTQGMEKANTVSS